jgi:hypothetical protein
LFGLEGGGIGGKGRPTTEEEGREEAL